MEDSTGEAPIKLTLVDQAFIQPRVKVECDTIPSGESNSSELITPLDLDPLREEVEYDQPALISLEAKFESAEPSKNVSDVTTSLKIEVCKSPGLTLISQFESTEDSESDSSSDDSVVVVSDTETVEKDQPLVDACPKVKGEVDYRDLPSEEECDIPFPPNGKVLPIGEVSHYAEKLIVIKAFPNTPAVNEGTVLWREDQTSIARIFETFGPVKTPYYSILVQSKEHADHLGLKNGDTVYVVPGDSGVTTYVFTDKLLEEKGCDASWKNDVEVPEEYQEFSDDEVESRKKQKKKKQSSDSRRKGNSLQQPSVVPNHNTQPHHQAQLSHTPNSGPSIQSPPYHPPAVNQYIPAPPPNAWQYPTDSRIMYQPLPYSGPFQGQLPYPPPPPGYYPHWPRYPP